MAFNRHKKALEIGQTYEGMVKSYNDAKGFGFIAVDGYVDVFFHISEVQEELEVNDFVTFTIFPGKRGDQIQANDIWKAVPKSETKAAGK